MASSTNASMDKLYADYLAAHDTLGVVLHQSTYLSLPEKPPQRLTAPKGYELGIPVPYETIQTAMTEKRYALSLLSEAQSQALQEYNSQRIKRYAKEQEELARQADYRSYPKTRKQYEQKKREQKKREQAERAERSKQCQIDYARKNEQGEAHGRARDLKSKQHEAG